MVAYFLGGLVLGAAVLMWLLYFSARREIVRIDEKKQLLRQEKETVIQFMHDLVQSIGQGVGRQELYDQIVHAAVLSTGGLSGCVYELEEGDLLVPRAMEGLFPPMRPVNGEFGEIAKTRTKLIEETLRSESFTLGEGFIGGVAQSKKAALVEDGSADPRIILHEDESLRIRSIIVAPILFQSKLLGLLAVANPADGSAFTKSELSLVESLAEQAGMAIHNSALMAFQIEKNKLDFDLSIASNIQGMLLPERFPSIKHLDIAASYIPAQKVGGDLYDVFDLPDGRVGLTIADVSGKGISGALMMAICQTHLRHFAFKYKSPADVLRALNKAVHSGQAHDVYLTIIFAVVDPKKKTVTLARAGHEMPLIFRWDEKKRSFDVEKVASESMALGMVEPEFFDAVIEDVTLHLHEGDVLVLYTDGVTEAENAMGQELGVDRMIRTIQNAGYRFSQDINQAVIDEVQAFSGKSRYADDFTLLTVKYK